MTNSAITKKTWTSDSKQIARLVTIIHPYQKIFGNKIPSNEQYWTFAGLQLSNKCEAKQIEAAGLIEPYQFQGVDINNITIQRNKKKYPQYNWHHDSMGMVKKLYQFRDNGKLFPAIVNIDHHLMLHNAIADFKYCLNILTNLNKEKILLVFNFLSKNPYNKLFLSRNEILETFSKSPEITECIKNNWKYYGCYEYSGCGKGNKKMFSVMLVK